MNRTLSLLIALAGACALAPLTAAAQALDSIDIERQDGTAQIQIRFNARVLYRRHVVSPAGDTIEIYIEEAARSEALLGVLEDTRRSPPSTLVPPFTVSYRAERAASLRRVVVTFARPVTVTARQGADADTIVLTVAVPAAEPTPPPPPSPAPPPAAPPLAVLPPSAPPPPTADVDAQARQLLAQARTALTQNRPDEALDALNRLLNLPPSSASREAQELVGNVRESLGQDARAQAEYRLFLRLYPDGPDADRVRQRLAALDAAAAPGGAAPTRRPRPAVASVWGSFSQYYYGGQSQVDTTTTVVTPATNATVIDTQRLTATDQSALATLVDLNARYRGDDWDNRFVFRDTYMASFLKDQRSRNRLYSLYGDIKNVRLGAQARLGRQTSTGGGVLGRYDGGSLSYSPTSRWRVGLLGGTPSEDTPGGRQTFFGQSLDFDNIVEGLGLGLFNIAQRVEGYTDRHAVGGELRYFDQHRSLFGYLDYDRVFRALNIASLQGSWTFAAGPSFNLLYDLRRAPTLQLSSLLLGDPTSTLRDALQARPVDEARAQVKAATPISRVFLVGTTIPVLPQWQLGVEYRASSLSAAAASGNLAATPATGRIDTYTLQAIGTSIWGRYDVVAVTGSYLHGERSTAWLAALNPRLQFFDHLRVEPSLRWYRQDDAATAVETVRLTPGLRLTYSVTDRFALESEATVERSRSDGPSISETVQRVFYFIGFRWDFEGRPAPAADRAPIQSLSQPKPAADPVNTLGLPRTGN